VVNKSNDRLVWIDCEMTGLDPMVEELVEVAVVITDYDLQILDPGFQIVIKPSDAALENMGDFVRQMHITSGLIEEIPFGHSRIDAQTQVLEYITRFVPQSGFAPLAGNTIGTDRVFIAQEMPMVHEHLHYRNIDVSTIKELSKRWFPKSYHHSPEKNGGHRALADILESIRELQYYRSAVFVESPGMATEQLKVVNDAISKQWASRL